MKPIISSLLLLCLAVNLTAQTIVTKIIAPSGGDYTSLSAFEAQNCNLASSNTVMIGEIRGTWSTKDTTAVAFAGWTTSSDYYVRVQADAANRATAKWDEGKYILRVTDAVCLTITVGNVKIFGIEIETVNPTVSGRHGIAYMADADLDGVLIDSCIIKGHANATYSQRGMYQFSTANSLSWTIRNCIIFNLTANLNSYCFRQMSSGTCIIENCTVYGAYQAYEVSPSMIVKATNCIAQNTVLGFNGTFTDSSNNASDLAADAPGANPQTGTVQFVDATNGDFHLRSDDVVARNNGLNLSATFTTDIDGNIRPSPWDIGADEYIPSVRPSRLLPVGGIMRPF